MTLSDMLLLSFTRLKGFASDMARSDVCLIFVDEEGIQADTEFLRARKSTMVIRIKRRELPSSEIMRPVVLRFVSSGERF